MGRSTLQLLLVFWPTLAVGQNTFSIVHNLPGTSASDGRSVFETDEGFLLFSATYVPAESRTWLYTTQLGVDGEDLGSHMFGSTRNLDSGVADCITQNPDGTFTAAISHFIAGEPDSLFLYHFNAQGDTISRHLVGVETALGVRDCLRTTDGNYLIAGWCALVDEPLVECACIRKVSATGAEIWRQLTEGHMAYFSVNSTEDGAFLIGGRRFNQGVNETVIKKVNSEGGTIWTRYIGGHSSYTGGSGHSVVMANGNYLIPGVWLPPDSAGVDEHGYAALYCFSPDGQQLWRKDLFYDRQAGATLVRRRPNDDLVITSAYLQVPRDPDMASTIWRTNAEGDTLYHRKYWYYGGYGAVNTGSYGMDITSDGGAIFTGLARQGESGEFPYRRYTWVLKLDEHGCLTPGCHTVGVQEYELALQQALRIQPNPASERCTYELALPEGYQVQGVVRALLLDAQGREVQRTITNASPATLSGALDLGHLPSGIYYMHLHDEVKWLAGGKVVVSGP